MYDLFVLSKCACHKNTCRSFCVLTSDHTPVQYARVRGHASDEDIEPLGGRSEVAHHFVQVRYVVDDGGALGYNRVELLERLHVGVVALVRDKCI